MSVKAAVRLCKKHGWTYSLEDRHILRTPIPPSVPQFLSLNGMRIWGQRNAQDTVDIMYQADVHTRRQLEEAVAEMLLRHDLSSPKQIFVRIVKPE